MRAELQPIDSEVLGRPVLTIVDFDPAADFAAFEREYVGRHDPVYAACKIPLGRVADAHVLEAHGFRLIECQIRSMIKLRRPYPVPAAYAFERVTEEAQLPEVLGIAGTTFGHDRFTVDRELGAEVSGRRYRAYVRKSFADPREAVYRLVERPTGRVVAFKTHRHTDDGQVLFLLGGVHPEYKALGLGIINSYCELNYLLERGVKRGVTHISASNLAVFNLEIGQLGFRVLETFAVLRKLYPGRHDPR